MKKRIIIALVLFAMLMSGIAKATTVNIWASNEIDGFDHNRNPLAGDLQLTQLADMTFVPDDGSGATYEFNIDDTITYQDFLGFGSSFEGSSTYNMSLLSETVREDLIESIVDPVNGIGLDLFRICIGTSDFTEDPLFYTYDDMPPGQTDPCLLNFSIDRDKEHIIPAIKIALQKNPDLLIFGSPWSPPGWMKDTDLICGGNMLDQYFSVYADYFVKFIQAYEAEGIPIHAVTPQNEPRMSKPMYPTCYWTPQQERDFIKYHLGPKFAAAGITTKIWIYDHNWDKPERDFPYVILDDPVAKQYVDGTGWHHYRGVPTTQTNVHNAHPDRHQYFTEGSKFGSDGAYELLAILRNWSRSYNAWVTFIDENGQPNSGPYGGGNTIVVYNFGDDMTYTFDYYFYGQFAKFIQRGAVRVESEEGGPAVGSVAFRNPDDTIVVVLVNQSNGPQSIKITYGGQMIKPTMTKKTITTYLWDVSGSTCGDTNCDPGEDQCNCPQDCGTPPATETNCDDGIDNDCDTYTDCDDTDCDGDPACPTCGDLTCDPGEDQCNCPADCGTPPATETNCTDGIDEDCDTYTDCDDSDCDGDPACPDCLPKGAICSDNSECCSGTCAGIKCK